MKKRIMEMKLSAAGFLCIVLLFVSCNGGGGSGVISAVGSYGSLSLSLSDASIDNLKAVYVTIKEVQVLPDKGADAAEDRRRVIFVDGTYNLLELVNGIQENLGITDLEAGRYSQMRLIIGDDPSEGLNVLGDPHPFANYIIDSSDQYQELKVPSGKETGIKLVKEFEIAEGATKDLVIDFDASRSVVQAGKSGLWLLKPVLTIFESTLPYISGTVIDAEQIEGLEGALVSIQSFNSGAADKKYRVAVNTSTLATEQGEYLLYSEAGTYTLVATKTGYGPAAKSFDIAPDFVYAEENLFLYGSRAGIVQGTVLLADGPDDASVVLSFQQEIPLQTGRTVYIEVDSITIANGGDFKVSLPEGRYSLIASADGYDTQEHQFSIDAVEPVQLAITF